MTRTWSRRTALFCAVALGASIPVSAALDNLLLAVLLVSLALGGAWRTLPALVRASPPAIAAMLLFGWLALGLLHGRAPAGAGVHAIGKYFDLLLVALLLPVFAAAAVRAWARGAFLLACTAAMVISYLLAFGWLAPMSGIRGNPINPVAFKWHITHGFFLALAAYLFVLQARDGAAPRWRIACALAAALAALDVLLLVQGRTGYVVLLALAVCLLVKAYRWRGLAAALVAVTATAALLYSASGIFHARVDKALAEIQRALAGDTTRTSLRERYEYAAISAEIVAAHPLTGVGTGGFSAAYAERAAARGWPPAQHPHNDYLLLAAQTGLGGVLLLGALFVAIWRGAARLPTRLERDLAHGLVIAYAVGGMFNSFLLDHAEGLLFAWMSALLFGGGATDPAPRAQAVA